MTTEEILNFVHDLIYQQFSGEGTGHDYFHIERVVKTAVRIAKEEKADFFLVELAAWLHDVGDHKLNGGIDKSEEQITAILKQVNTPSETIAKVIDIVSQVSFSKGKVAESLEAKIVQDADRLDAIGAIGIARAFAFGGSKLREIHNPEKPAETSVKHFYDKLLKLKDKMNTNTGRAIAEQRHQYLENFLQRFYKEWNGED
ncbi:HD domain-containing protein [Niabella ginsengisoli]|uniref:HD domain-containing protein n=1 Tax=Niabella ginsengisoli TaxID=522298 RepID=A0ABS9SI67_9BACT|nr:HD domain-containing protein [Niabella ginsengisoli]MCH5597859.1 HD domain-containing protein [Niabella ginsengisoli]